MDIANDTLYTLSRLVAQAVNNMESDINDDNRGLDPAGLDQLW
jgi:hypothetical protein